MLAFLKWFVGYFRRRAIKTQILIVLIIVATLMGCFGLLTPSLGPRGGPAPGATPQAGGMLVYTAV